MSLDKAAVRRLLRLAPKDGTGWGSGLRLCDRQMRTTSCLRHVKKLVPINERASRGLNVLGHAEQERGSTSARVLHIPKHFLDLDAKYM